MDLEEGERERERERERGVFAKTLREIERDRQSKKMVRWCLDLFIINGG